MKNTYYYFLLFFLYFIQLSQKSWGQTFGSIDIPIYKNGVLLSNAAVGGLKIPHFSNIDIDGDGIKDLLVFDRTGNQVMPFIKTGPIGNTDYRYAPEYINDFPQMSGWVLLRDYNGDGIEDIFTSNNDFNIRVWKGSRLPNGRLSFSRLFFENVSKREILNFKIDGNYAEIYNSNLDVPAIVDIDNDGDLDVFTFSSSSVSVSFYKNMSVELGRPLDEFHFIRPTTCWGNFVEGQLDEIIKLSDNPLICARNNVSDGINSGQRHDGSTLNILSLNGDDLPDLLIGDIGFSNIQALINGGTKDNAHMISVEKNFPIYDTPIDIRDFVATFSVDVDGDDIVDLIATTVSISGTNKDHIWYYKNMGNNKTPQFKLMTKNFLLDKMPNLYSNSHPCFVDVNQDGLMDLVVGTGGFKLSDVDRVNSLVLMLNTGTNTQPKFEIIDEDYLSLSRDTNIVSRLAPSLGDMDNDGDLDLIIGDAVGRLTYFENIAGPGQTFAFSQTPQYKYPNDDFSVLENSKPFIYDVNGDGLYDIIVGKKNVQLHVLINQGTKENPVFTSNPRTLPNIFNLGSFIPNNSFRFGNGAPHIIISEGRPILLFGTENSGILSYDTGEDLAKSPFTQILQTTETLLKDSGLVPSLYDIDNDGYYEMAVGNTRGGILFFSTHFKTGSSNIVNNSLSKDIKIYPNPAKGWFTISGITAGTQLELYNINGQYIRNLKSEDIIDVSDLNSGTYYLKLQNSTEVYTHKIVIIK